MRKVGFEYRNPRGRTPFEIFLQYSDEKKKSAVVLGRLLKGLLRGTEVSMIDVGAGNGEYIQLALSRLNLPYRMKLVLLEPSQSLIPQLRKVSRRLSVNLVTSVRQAALDEYTPKMQFDVVLASHLPFQKDRLPSIYSRMLTWLKPHGSLIVILRKHDDIHDFRTKFKSRLLGTPIQSLTIDDALIALGSMALASPLRISGAQACAVLTIPILTKPTDTRTIIEFLLNKKWKDFPEEVRQEVSGYLRKKRGQLRINDGFLVATKQ